LTVLPAASHFRAHSVRKKKHHTLWLLPWATRVFQPHSVMLDRAEVQTLQVAGSGVQLATEVQGLLALPAAAAATAPALRCSAAACYSPSSCLCHICQEAAARVFFCVAELGQRQGTEPLRSDTSVSPQSQACAAVRHSSAEGRLREALASGDAHTAVVQLKHLSRSLHSAQLTSPAQARRHGFVALSHHSGTMILQHGGP